VDVYEDTILSLANQLLFTAVLFITSSMRFWISLTDSGRPL
jgi:hypothetical protein